MDIVQYCFPVFIPALTFPQFTLIHLVLADLTVRTRILESQRFIQHGSTSVYGHSLSVARLSMKIAGFFGWHIDEQSLVRGALLHDYFLYDWHVKNRSHKWHGFTHPAVALANARRDCILNPVETDIIIHHMFPLTPVPPLTKEGIAVCLADKICSLRETFCRHHSF